MSILVTTLNMKMMKSPQNENFNESDNIEIYTKQYLNTTDTIHINTFNGFTLINSKRINNKDGSVRVILDFDEPLK